LEALKEGNKRIEWKDRKLYAFWKGNPYMSRTRMELMKCRISDKQDWNVHLYIQVNFFIKFLDFYFKEYSYNSRINGWMSLVIGTFLIIICSKRKDIKYQM